MKGRRCTGGLLSTEKLIRNIQSDREFPRSYTESQNSSIIAMLLSRSSNWASLKPALLGHTFRCNTARYSRKRSASEFPSEEANHVTAVWPSASDVVYAGELFLFFTAIGKYFEFMERQGRGRWFECVKKIAGEFKFECDIEEWTTSRLRASYGFALQNRQQKECSGQVEDSTLWIGS